MTYDRELADRVRAALSAEPGVTEKAMFGGLAFLVDGSLAVAASGKGGLMVRCDPARADELTAADGVARMVMRGREMDGWLRVLHCSVQAASRRTRLASARFHSCLRFSYARLPSPLPAPPFPAACALASGEAERARGRDGFHLDI